MVGLGRRAGITRSSRDADDSVDETARMTQLGCSQLNRGTEYVYRYNVQDNGMYRYNHHGIKTQ